jgi:aryl-alcohol dehydrogenase-like predicted oxidoreductase
MLGRLSVAHPETNLLEKRPARAVFTTILYRPTRHATRVRSPALLVMAERDQVISSRSVKRELKRLHNAQLLALNCTHFDLYQGHWFDRTITMEQDFLVRHLRR